MNWTSLWFAAFVSTVVLAFGAANSASAGTILLQVDVTDPLAVVVSATGAAADMSTPGYYPIELRNFFTSDVGSGSVGGNLSLQITEGHEPIADVRFDQSGPRNLDLTPIFFGGLFVAGQQAFTGSDVFNLSGLPLPGPGATGPIFVNGTEIGAWAIPEPASAALLMLCGLFNACRRLLAQNNPTPLV